MNILFKVAARSARGIRDSSGDGYDISAPSCLMTAAISWNIFVYHISVYWSLSRRESDVARVIRIFIRDSEV